ncbi:GCFC-domain-containing protein [Fomitopsis serialis]|uniref:GCFC-domain-containing protein n=1 Tax=Fomitopsis serialis TaxID=139415 RepID=UPI002008187D|nr:GCFC-domain-containing protein [Neoantrodia serialis]KAH9936526.1 GCFC-domain-containing protein [Neoantrodia serialis]
MADAPVVFKKTKTKSSQRSRVSTPVVADSTGDDQTADVEDAESPSILATKLKKKLKTREKPKSRLSFGADEEGEGEAFQVKKSNLSRKLALGQHPASAGNVKTASIDLPSPSRSDSSVRYDAAYLKQLKASTPSTRPSMPEGDLSYDADMSMVEDSLPQSHMTGIIDLSAEAELETTIPSASAVQVAREKRERLRTLGTSSTSGDYISLSVSKGSDFSQGPHPESRLVREEDELGEADDEYAEYTSAQERIALGKKSRKVEAKKRREEMNELIADAEEVDEETMEWEQEQLRRGGLRVNEPPERAPKPTYKAAPIPPITPIPTLGAAVARLTSSLTALTTSHQQNTATMTSLGDEQLKLEAREEEMREMIAEAEDKRSWFAAFREWVESVATFLDEKYPELEKLEDEQVYLLKERADMVAQRRRAEDEDDLSLVLGTLPQAAPTGDEVDDLGRLVPHTNSATARRARLDERAKRRLLRRAGGKAQSNEEEGYSTDSSLPPSDAADYQTAMSRLVRDGRAIMSDVQADEFKDPNRGLGKWFGGWRTRFGDSYTGAWGGLGMVGAWEFWARLEILGWNPLEDDRTLDSFSWYDALYQYSRPSQSADQGEDEEPELGPDGDLVSAMISTAVIPRLCKLLEGGAFDPYSATDVRKLTDLAEQIELSVERSNLKFEMLLKSVFTVFQGAVTSTDSVVSPYLALNQPRFDPEAIPARRRFLTRRYKLLRNLLQWRKYTGEQFGLGQLAQNLVDHDMLPVAEGGWEVGGEEYIRKVAGLIPNELMPISLKNSLGM